MALSFITGNGEKFSEAKAILPRLEQLKIDLVEIQEIDPKKIIEAKLQEAYKHASGQFIVEDVSLRMECMYPLPGPLIKWYLQEKGIVWLANEAQLHNRLGAEAICMVGYARNEKEMHFFEGKVAGTIVAPAGDRNFGWDPIFRPNGYDLTYAQMSKEQKNNISPRRLALEKLKEFMSRESL